MTPERLVLDTYIVIDLLKKQPKAVNRFLALVASQTVFLISHIMVAEVYAGAFKREHKDIEAFFGMCEHVETDSDNGRIAGLYANQYRKAFQGTSLEECLLVATAKAHRCPFWTGNRKRYPMTDVKIFST